MSDKNEGGWKNTSAQYLEKRKKRRERNKRKKEESMSREHPFWKTQPVPQLGEKSEKYRRAEPFEEKTVDQVRPEPYNLPRGYEWHEFDVTDDAEMRIVYKLLEKHYVEDDDSTFRFAYPIEFLRWALTPPGWAKDLHIAVRTTQGPKPVYVALITGVPCNIHVIDKLVPMVEINFLCVHKSLRKKKLAQLLIKEVTRRTNLKNVWQAVYTAGRFIPKPVSTAKYFHRSLNPEKLCAIKFSSVPKKYRKFDDGMERLKRNLKLRDRPKLRGWRPMRREDCVQVAPIFNEYMKKNFKLYQVYDEEEFAHWMMPRENVISSFVVENQRDKKITDFVFFYHLPSTVINNPRYRLLKAAYMFYYVHVMEKNRLSNLIESALIEARNEGFDVFNCLNIMNNEKVFTEHKFKSGDGCLYYYLYNMKCPELKPYDVGITML